MAGAIGGLISSVVGSAVSSVVGNMMSSLISNFGSSNIAGAFVNAFMGSLGTALKTIIDNAPLPQFLKDAAKDLIDNVIGSNQQATTPEAQDAVDCEYGDTLTSAAESTAQQAAEEAEGQEGVNWLVALAGSLAKTQGTFLKAALESQETMNGIAGKEGKEQEFLDAQAEYQANMQMFTMMANMTATTLKSLGEGLTAIARKQ